MVGTQPGLRLLAEYGAYRRARRREERQLAWIGEHGSKVAGSEGSRQPRRERVAQQAHIVIDVVVATIGALGSGSLSIQVRDHTAGAVRGAIDANPVADAPRR